MLACAILTGFIMLRASRMEVEADTEAGQAVPAEGIPG
jgi:hypothetical protein